MYLDTAATCVSACAALVALIISGHQTRLSNRQKLFSRRLNLWMITSKLLGLCQEHVHLLERDDGPQFRVDSIFEWLTNTSFLQEVQGCIHHAGESEFQLALHLKLDEMESLAVESGFIFKGEAGKAVSGFIDAYQGFLLAMYKYKILLNHVHDCAHEMHLTLEEVPEYVNEPEHRKELLTAEDVLRAAYKRLEPGGMQRKIDRQIRLIGGLGF